MATLHEDPSTRRFIQTFSEFYLATPRDGVFVRHIEGVVQKDQPLSVLAFAAILAENPESYYVISKLGTPALAEATIHKRIAELYLPRELSGCGPMYNAEKLNASLRRAKLNAQPEVLLLFGKHPDGKEVIDMAFLDGFTPEMAFSKIQSAASQAYAKLS